MFQWSLEFKAWNHRCSHKKYRRTILGILSSSGEWDRIGNHRAELIREPVRLHGELLWDFDHRLQYSGDACRTGADIGHSLDWQRFAKSRGHQWFSVTRERKNTRRRCTRHRICQRDWLSSSSIVRPPERTGTAPAADSDWFSTGRIPIETPPHCLHWISK
ncbi:MAG: hypothetical protein ACI9R3_002661 [Verrucomicrobiales bacterium]|jgi:hypothetical protein